MEIDILLDRAATGDSRALTRLLMSQRAALEEFVAAKITSPLDTKVTPADIVQEALLEAASRLTWYLRCRPAPFPEWMQTIALQKVAQVQEAQTGNCDAPVPPWPRSLAASADGSTIRTIGSKESPKQGRETELQRRQWIERLWRYIERLPADDQQVLRLRFRQHLPVAGIAAELGIPPTTVRVRQLAALRRLRHLMDAEERSET